MLDKLNIRPVEIMSIAKGNHLILECEELNSP